MIDQTHFAPDWASPPGRTIQALLDKRGVMAADLAGRLEISLSSLQELLDGTYRITDELADQLQVHLGATARFWKSREEQFRTAEAMPEISTDALADRIPLRDMIRFGWLDRFRRDDGELAAALRFFGLKTPGEFNAKYEGLTAALAFRRSASFEVKPGSLAAWFRAAEIQTESAECADWNRPLFVEALSKARALTRERDPAQFIPRLRDICGAAGVVVAIVRAPTGCPVSGATFFSNPRRAVILLSARHLTDDHFWFSFFHEAGHVVLHGENTIFVETDSSDFGNKEQEANEFSSSLLVPGCHQQMLRTLAPTKYDIVRFARLVGVSPGIITGQLQHLGLLRRNQFNFLKRKYKFNASLERQ
ncbi:ImmA/IrrE family metallo-endopeptidase [Lysobacter koreensis]|uniref:ImmA/IrrE family metallo-endopeptidase n=1 Tax=Lysobacter koreensis TaxID=266122 RepID=A0ABW2YSH8_9GAMM